MDDLDHSIHIAEFDWASFYDESEECGLRQPALAFPEYLSDSEGSLNPGSVFSTRQQETQQNAELDSDVTESNCKKSPLKLNVSLQVTGVTQVDCEAGTILGTKEVHLKTSEDVQEERSDITNTLQPETLCSGASITLKKRDENEQIENVQPNPLNVKEPCTVDGAVSVGGSNVPARAEKERWFVTVNYSPAWPRARAPTVKKKRRQKKTCKISHTCCYRQEESLEEITAGVREAECFTETNPERVSDLLQMSCEEHIESDFSEVTMDKNKPQPESAESDEFSSIHSYDSESYLSAAESAEGTQHLLAEQLQPVDSDSIQLQSSVSLLSETGDADSTRHRQMRSFHSTLFSNVTVVNCDRNECTVDTHHAPAFPSAGQRANKLPDDSSMCDINTHSTQLHVLSDTPGVQKQNINPTASGSSSGDQLSSIPDLIVTPCSVADSPDTHAEAAYQGHTRPVFAISAFWNEMEKLTINDILQLRMSKSTEETVIENAEETSHSSFVELSDTADSDYFTQPDESKPECSSCEFSTSDFEEEYWQFVGTSRNSSPDPHGKSQEINSDCSLLSYEEQEETTGSEGKQRPVPSEDFAHFEDQESNILNKLAWQRQMSKSKSMYNVQALNQEDHAGPWDNAESSLPCSTRQSMTEVMVLKDNNSLETSAPAFLLSNYYTDAVDEHFPEVFEYFFTEDKTKESGCITVYNPKEVSVAPIFDYSLCPLRDDVPFSSLHDSLCSKDKPIPIFSCCPPTVREITFPKLDNVFLRTEKEVDDFSPIRVMSCSFIQAYRYGTHLQVAGGSHSWKPLWKLSKMGFRYKGSMWHRRSGTWMFPPEHERVEEQAFAYPQVFLRELAVQPSILKAKETSRQEGIFSTLKQSDMCLVCIAFASWVLRSSDPENADTWKTALLANVSALSAIQYLRHYMKRRPRQDDP